MKFFLVTTPDTCTSPKVISTNPKIIIYEQDFLWLTILTFGC